MWWGLGDQSAALMKPPVNYGERKCDNILPWSNSEPSPCQETSNFGSLSVVVLLLLIMTLLTLLPFRP